jgi:lipopolysaccharide export system permease protein
MMSQKRILLITSTRLGDAVLSTGLAGALAERMPGSRFTIACGALPAPLFRHFPGLERLIPLVKRPYAGHWRSLWLECLPYFWEWVVDLRNSPVSRLLLARRRLVLPRSRPDRHRVCQIGAILGSEVPPPAPRLWLSTMEREEAARRIPEGSFILAVAPIANWRGKTWPGECFVELALRLCGPEGLWPEGRVALFGASSERSSISPIQRRLEEHLGKTRVLDLAGNIDPLQAGACLERCGFFIGNDSGLAHLAAAAGIPTLALFGPSRPEHYAPWGKHGAFVRTALDYENLLALPGFSFTCQDRSFMESLSVEAAEAGVRSLWERVLR